MPTTVEAKIAPSMLSSDFAEMETKKLETSVQRFESLQKRVTYQNDSIWSIPGISKCSIFSLCAFMCCLQPTTIPPRPQKTSHQTSFGWKDKSICRGEWLHGIRRYAVRISEAKVVMEAVNKPRNISYKGLTDLVTDTDKMSEAAILSVVRKKFPNHLILGEEADYLWCIDPLDGTINFAHRYPSFAVSVGVLFKGKPAAAAVVEFVRGAMCWNTHTFTVVAGMNYWQMNKVLEALLPKEVLAGNHSLVTKVVENGVQFHIDLATVYWSSKLATERQRLLNSFTQSDVFSGVGPLAISAAKKVKHVYANDLNPHAIDYLERNCVLKKLGRKIEDLLDEVVCAVNTHHQSLPSTKSLYLELGSVAHEHPSVGLYSVSLFKCAPDLIGYIVRKADFHAASRGDISRLPADQSMYHTTKWAAETMWIDV
ncbi:hypothetical protein L2E82_45152 [Cichorium intybus]|uniref:Uncharacterized protein n=1 Tax=Cichorium intybus TaxID=13427 RepID=A0ACB8ZS30_CICIN|nr:hypothetical protein L2E82_45152 [Cichorium intybus]